MCSTQSYYRKGLDSGPLGMHSFLLIAFPRKEASDLGCKRGGECRAGDLDTWEGHILLEGE